MARWLRCKNRHSWKWTAPPSVWPPDFRSTCPECGEGPISGRFSWTGLVGFVFYISFLSSLFAAAGLAMFFLAAKGAFFLWSRFLGAALVVMSIVFPVLIGVVAWNMRQRTKKTAAVAEQMGFTFVPIFTLPSLQAVAPFQLFAQRESPGRPNWFLVSVDAFRRGYTGVMSAISPFGGLGKQSRDGPDWFRQGGYPSFVMQGRVGGTEVLVLDYLYTFESGQGSRADSLKSRAVSQTAVILFDGAAGLPDFLLLPKKAFDKQVGFGASDVIALEDAGEFAQRCVLTGPDAAAVRKIFSPNLIQYLGHDGQWFIEAAKGQLLLYRSPKVPPDWRPDLATSALRIRDMLHGAGRIDGKGETGPTTF
ncbi:MAG TPA: hypothetical protein VMS17_08680 [Gemmataceae bacterium]|nr:hypothetical protein [Gemmataceae bacterium]